LSVRRLIALTFHLVTEALHGRRRHVNVRFEVFTAVTMKNVVFCEIKTQFIPHRRHITSPLQSPAS
jgi:hypothetical protein